VTAKAAGSPTVRPIPTGSMLCLNTSMRMSRAVAPIAVRMPISCVRRLTPCATTAYKPIDASAVTAKIRNSAALMALDQCSNAKLFVSTCGPSIDPRPEPMTRSASARLDLTPKRRDETFGRDAGSPDDGHAPAGLLPKWHVHDRIEGLPGRVLLHDVRRDADNGPPRIWRRSLEQPHAFPKGVFYGPRPAR
jgi:hypothetical protein